MELQPLCRWLTLLPQLHSHTKKELSGRALGEHALMSQTIFPVLPDTLRLLTRVKCTTKPKSLNIVRATSSTEQPSLTGVKREKSTKNPNPSKLVSATPNHDQTNEGQLKTRTKLVRADPMPILREQSEFEVKSFYGRKSFLPTRFR